MNSPILQNPKRDWFSLALAGLFGMASATFLLISVVLFVLGLGSRSSLNSNDQLSLIILSSGVFVLGMLRLPALYFNFVRFLNLPINFSRILQFKDQLYIPMIIIAWLLALRSGFWVSQDPILTPLILPVINILAVGLPVLFFVRISLRGLNLPSARRAWSVFGASMVVSPFLAFIVESIAVLGIIILLFAISSFIPGLQVVIKQVLAASRTGIFDEEILTRNLSNLLLTPPMAITALGTFSFLVPLIEETFKTILIWPLLSRLRYPSDGFVLGILCGAAFALTENIGFVSTGSFDWAGTVVSRTTAVLPHILNSGIMGWALVSAWTEKRYLRLGLSFLSVVLLHGAWNATSLGLAMNDLAANVSDAPLLLKFSFPWYSAWIILTLGSFGGLIFSNIQIRKIQFREQV